MSVVILRSSHPSGSPVSENELTQIISEELPFLDTAHDFAFQIALKLRAKTSKYKFLVSVIKVELDTEADTDVDIHSKIAVAWDDKKDGFWSTRVDTEHRHMITVFWVYAG